MSKFPQGWTSVTLEHHVYIAGRIGWRGLKRSEYTKQGPLFLAVKNILPTGGIDFTDTDHITQERYVESPEIQLRVNDILLTKDGTIGKVGMITSLPRETTVNSSILVVRPDELILPRFFFHFLRGPQFQSIANQRITGSAIPHLFQKDIKKLEALVPPLNEQRRIVTKLEKLLSHVNEAQTRLATIPHILKRFRQSVLAAACSGRLTADWRRKEGVSEEYEPALIDEVADYVGGFAYRSPTFTGTGFNQVVRIGNVRPFSLKLEASPVFIPDAIAGTTERFELALDDIVISMTGTKYKKDYGYAAIVTRTDHKLFLNQRVSRLRCNERVLPRFMLYWLQTDTFRDFFFEGETGNVNQGNIGADGIRRAPIELPSLSEQQEIVRRVGALFKTADALEARYRAAKAYVDKLTQSILAKAFRGELVPQDPNDEPASVLLGRIITKRKLHGKE